MDKEERDAPGKEMANFVETMRLKGLAEEDIYFARRDRELIAALREYKATHQPVADASWAAKPSAPAAGKQKAS